MGRGWLQKQRDLDVFHSEQARLVGNHRDLRRTQGEAIHGTFSPATGEATWKAAYQSTDTIDFHVTFHFKSTSTAKTNHPTYIGWYDYVVIATGATQPGGTTRGWRCSR